MLRTACVLFVGALASVATSGAQEPTAVRVEPRQRTWGVSGGYGSGYGGIGGGVDWYFAKGRLSLAVGGGYFPTRTEGAGSGAAGAGIRAYTRGARHRALMELSVALLYLSWRQLGDVVFDVHRYYGPGISGGYQYVTTGGFTVLATAGVGWDPNRGRLSSVGNLGIGYTWRR